MAGILRRSNLIPRYFRQIGAMSYSSGQMGDLGSGAGKGGGGGGSIREAGGSFGKIEAGREEEYFYKLQREQLKNLKGHIKDEIRHHEQEIQRLEESIKRHQNAIKEQTDKMQELNE